MNSNSNNEYNEETVEETIKSNILVVLGSLIYAFSVVWVLELGDFVSSGVTGTSQIIVRIPTLFGGKSFDGLLGLLIGLINIPLVIIGWKGVSKRYAILTVVSIVVQTIATTLISNFTVSPLCGIFDVNSGTSEGVVECIQNGALNIFNVAEKDAIIQNFKATMDTGTRLMLAIFGGIMAGFGASLCLKAGGSTGGIDIIASYLQTKKGLSFTKYQTIIDGTIILLSAIFSVKMVLFTLVRLYVYVKVVDLVYNSYKIARLEIITSKGEEMRCKLINKFHHGVTIFNALGGYTLSERQVLEVYISAYEVDEYLRTIQKVDPTAFVIRTKVRIVNGRYIQKTIL